MSEINITLTDDTIRAVKALQKRIGADDVYLYLWIFLEQWCTKEISLFEINTPIFLQVLSQIENGTHFSAFAHDLMEEILAEIDNDDP